MVAAVDPARTGEHPPHDLDSENAVLGALLAGAPVPSDLQPEHFLRHEHRLIYGAVLAVAQAGDPVNELTVTRSLRESGTLEAVGGATVVSALTDSLPDVANVNFFARRVIEEARRREAARLGGRLRHGEPLDAVLPALEALARAGAAGGSGARKAVWRSLREYKENPELLQPPEEIVPGFAFRGRVTLLAGREKFGKSTLASDVVATLSRTEGARVLWVRLEESPFDVVERFDRAGADLDAVIVSEYLPARLADLTAEIEAVKPDLVVIDTLGAWGADRVTDWNAAAQVTPVMLELVELARRYNVALVILHHGKKTDGTYRDSTAIGANVDVIIEMLGDANDDSVRHFTPRGRWTIAPFSMRFNGTHYEPVAGELPIHDRVYRFVASNPGCSKRAIRDNVPGRTSTKDEAIARLVSDRRIEDRGGPTGAEYYASIDAIATFGPCPDPPEMAINGARHGHGMVTPPRAPEEPNGALDGHGMVTPRGTPPVPHPLTGGCGGTVVGGAAGGTPEPLPPDPFDWTGKPKARLDELLSSGMRTAAAVEKVRTELRRNHDEA